MGGGALVLRAAFEEGLLLARGFVDEPLVDGSVDGADIGPVGAAELPNGDSLPGTGNGEPKLAVGGSEFGGAELIGFG